MSSSDESVCRPHDVILADEESDDSVEITKEGTKEVSELVRHNTEVVDKGNIIIIKPTVTEGTMTMQPEGDTPTLTVEEETNLPKIIKPQPHHKEEDMVEADNLLLQQQLTMDNQANGVQNAKNLQHIQILKTHSTHFSNHKTK